MKLAVLFSYHVEPVTCLERVRLIRQWNPAVCIHGLFSGNPEDQRFKPVADLLDSNYLHPPAPPEWLWRNYDKVICHWFTDTGSKLEWDFIFIHAWDLVVLDSLAGFTAGMTQRQVALPGVRRLEDMDEDIADPTKPPQKPGNWSWLRDGQKDLRAFKRYLLSVFATSPQLYCEVSPFAVLSREFCQSYSAMADPVPGFNEYRFPTLVPLLGYSFAPMKLPHNFWNYYNAEKQAVSPDQICKEYAKPDGCRLFHPVYEPVRELLL